MKFLLIFLWITTTLFAFDYQSGRGMNLFENETLSLNLGGHIDTYYKNSSETNRSIGLDQAGVFLFGTITPSISFLIEAGSDDIIDYDLKSKTSTQTDLRIMRAYAAYRFDDALSLKAGVFLTPIGIWNRTYIPALRWSNFTPYVAKGFFPKIIAGGDISGSVLNDRSLSYSLFYHQGGEYDTNKNNVIANEFVGGEVRYHFNTRSKIALPFGRYRSNTSEEICLFTGVNALWFFDKNELSSEFIFKDGEWIWENGNTSTWMDYAWYVQYVQHLYETHFLALRAGQSARINSMHNRDELNVVLGYIYKPKRSLSLKAEYRHSKRSMGDASGDEGLVSFSVLF